jgi:hypothetical protein
MLRITPAMQAGIADHICSLQELVGLLERRTEGVSMKRWPTVAAAIAGAVVAFFVEITVGTALSLRTSLPTAAKVSLVILCPAIYLGWQSAWLPPILNAMLYAAIAFGIAKWRTASKRANSK